MKTIKQNLSISLTVFVAIALITLNVIGRLTHKQEPPTFTVKSPKKEQVVVPSQECRKFLNINPHACDKG